MIFRPTISYRTTSSGNWTSLAQSIIEDWRFIIPKTDQERFDCFMIGLKRRNPSDPEFAQAVYGVALDNAHPRKWVDPEPKFFYNLVVIAGGAGGLVSSAGAAGVGACIALIESHLLGGDCLNVGCVQSKASLRCAKAAAAVRDAGQFGISLRVMKHRSDSGCNDIACTL